MTQDSSDMEVSCFFGSLQLVKDNGKKKPTKYIKKKPERKQTEKTHLKVLHDRTGWRTTCQHANIIPES